MASLVTDRMEKASCPRAREIPPLILNDVPSQVERDE